MRVGFFSSLPQVSHHHTPDPALQHALHWPAVGDTAQPLHELTVAPVCTNQPVAYSRRRVDPYSSIVGSQQVVHAIEVQLCYATVASARLNTLE